MAKFAPVLRVLIPGTHSFCNSNLEDGRISTRVGNLNARKAHVVHCKYFPSTSSLCSLDIPSAPYNPYAVNQKPFSTWPILIASLLLAFGLSTQTRAQTTLHPKATHPQAKPQAQSGNANTLLDDAYATLAQCKHDYDGHRVRAMKQIELALGVEGGRVSGHGNARESQGASDAQMRAAEGLLNEAKGSVSKKGMRHVDRALEQLQVALRIK